MGIFPLGSSHHGTHTNDTAAGIAANTYTQRHSFSSNPNASCACGHGFLSSFLCSVPGIPSRYVVVLVTNTFFPAALELAVVQRVASGSIFSMMAGYSAQALSLAATRNLSCGDLLGMGGSRSANCCEKSEFSGGRSQSIVSSLPRSLIYDALSIPIDAPARCPMFGP